MENTVYYQFTYARKRKPYIFGTTNLHKSAMAQLYMKSDMNLPVCLLVLVSLRPSAA